MNWKARLLSLHAKAMTEVAEFKSQMSEDNPKPPGRILVLLGRVQLAEEMLLEYGVKIK